MPAPRGLQRALPILLILCIGGCTNRMVRTVESFRNAVEAGDSEAADAFRTEDPRTWYGSREGPGEPWNLRGGRWKAWDDEFNSVSDIGSWHVEDDRVYAVVIEDNDYYRAIGREPSPWLLTYFFDERGRIEGRMVSAVPDRLLAPGGKKPDLGEAFDQWLRERYPQDYDDLRPGGRIDPTGDRAARTRARLEQWRREIGLAPIGGGD